MIFVVLFIILESIIQILKELIIKNFFNKILNLNLKIVNFEQEEKESQTNTAKIIT